MNMLTLFDLIIFGILLILGNLAIMVLGLKYVMSESYMRKIIMNSMNSMKYINYADDVTGNKLFNDDKENRGLTKSLFFSCRKHIVIWIV